MSNDVRMTTLRFALRGWSAWAPGLDGAAAWLAWARHPFLPSGDEQPALATMAPLMRRRLGRLGRIALQAQREALEALGATSTLPMVVASRYGDAHRALALIDELAETGSVAPAGFSLSVHNAIGAVSAIARGDRANLVSVAGGRCSAAASMVEAAGLLADGEAEVMLLCYDEALPVDYAVFADEPSSAWAWAVRVAQPGPGEAAFALSTIAPASAAAPALPPSLDVLRFLLGDDAVLDQHLDGQHWRWQRPG